MTKEKYTDSEGVSESGVRKSRFEYHEITGLLAAEVVEPGSAYELKTVYTRDQFGQVSYKTLFGAGLEPGGRVVEKTFSPGGYFPEWTEAQASTDGVLHVNSYFHDEATGNVLQRIDANNLSTSWSHDETF